MTQDFEYFVILGVMRTGSNFLEEQLSRVPGIGCYGELFNPVFVGQVKQETFRGVDMAQREADPYSMLEALRSIPSELSGFRYFEGHDERVFQHVIQDPKCAKIVLKRNPLDSFLSLQIAQRTGQWKLTNFTRRKEAKIRFSPDLFSEYLDATDAYYARVFDSLAESGQSAFVMSYENIGDINIFNGLLRYLGTTERIDRFHGKLKKQNPGTPVDLVNNPEEMKCALAKEDRFGLFRSVRFEPRRFSPFVRTFAISNPDVFFIPVDFFEHERFVSWLSTVSTGSGVNKFKERDEAYSFLCAHRDAVKFSYVEHPLRRAHTIFCNRLLVGEGQNWENIRRIVKQQHNVPIPVRGIIKERWGLEAHVEAFTAFLRFIKDHSSGLSNVPKRPEWSSQSMLLSSVYDDFNLDLIVKGSSLIEDMALLCFKLGIDAVNFPPRVEKGLFPLADVQNDEIDELVIEAYKVDFDRLGFECWQPELDLDQ